MISPKVGVWFNFAFLLLSGIAAGSAKLVGLSVEQVEFVRAVAANMAWMLAMANLVFHLWSSDQGGPGPRLMMKLGLGGKHAE